MTKVTALPAGINLSIRQYCDEMGIHRATLTKKIRGSNLIPIAKRGLHPIYRLRDLLRIAFLSDEDGEIDPDKLRPFERHAHYRAEREKIGLQVDANQLIPVDEVRQNYAAVFREVALMFDTLPDIVERDCAASAVMIARIERKLDEVREELYQKLDKDEANETDVRTSE